MTRQEKLLMTTQTINQPPNPTKIAQMKKTRRMSSNRDGDTEQVRHPHESCAWMKWMEETVCARNIRKIRMWLQRVFVWEERNRDCFQKHEGQGMKRSSLVIQFNLGFIRWINKVLYDDGIVNWISSHSLIMKRMVVDDDLMIFVDSDPCPHLVHPLKEGNTSMISLWTSYHSPDWASLLCDLLNALSLCLSLFRVSDEFNLLTSFILVESAKSWVKSCIWNLLFVCFNIL